MAQAKGKAKGKAVISKSITKSNRAGLIFPVGRIARILKSGKYADRVGGTGPVYLTAVLEYLMAEILEISVNIAKSQKKTRITPRHLLLAIKEDKELNTLLKNAVLISGGIRPERGEKGNIKDSS